MAKPELSAVIAELEKSLRKMPGGDFATIRQISDGSGKTAAAVSAALKEAKRLGRLEVGQAVVEDLSGRVRRVPGFRIKSK